MAICKKGAGKKSASLKGGQAKTPRRKYCGGGKLFCKGGKLKK